MTVEEVDCLWLVHENGGVHCVHHLGGRPPCLEPGNGLCDAHLGSGDSFEVDPDSVDRAIRKLGL